MKKTVADAIEVERQYQRDKYGSGKEQSLPGYILIMRAELLEAELAWIKNKGEDRQSPLEEILQVVSVGVACLEAYGVAGSAVPTKDTLGALYLVCDEQAGSHLRGRALAEDGTELGRHYSRSVASMRADLRHKVPNIENYQVIDLIGQEVPERFRIEGQR